LRRQRVAPSLSAILRKSGPDGSRPEKAYPEIAISGTADAWLWNTLIDSMRRITASVAVSYAFNSPLH
jgi:hypothetical protein